jgi:monofunctional biosynthetic peptidoglycan transglycosylase
MLQVASLRFVDPPFTATMVWDRLHSRGVSRFHWQPLQDISPHLRKAVLAGEDQRFLSHHGFDFVELDKAIRDFIRRKWVRGASTISMQVARTVFLWPERSLLRKAVEAYYTILIELFWSKERIFEIYLNTVNWGQGVKGAQAAARHYFHIDATDLDPHQGALLAAILPGPHVWSPIEPNEIVKERQRRILQDMEKMPLV